MDASGPFKISCTCQNYNGHLYFSKDECYFSSPLFRVDIRWDNIKSSKLDTKLIKGAATSVLAIKLQKQQSSSVPAGDAAENAKQKRSSSKKYYFYGFQDLLSAEAQFKSLWDAFKASHDVSTTDAPTNPEAPSNGKSGLLEVLKEDVSAADSKAVGTPSSEVAVGGGVAEDAASTALRPLTETDDHTSRTRRIPQGRRPLRPPSSQPKGRKDTKLAGALRTTVDKAVSVLVALLLRRWVLYYVVVMLFSLAAYGIRDSMRGPFKETERLLSELHAGKEYFHSLHNYASLSDLQDFKAVSNNAGENSGQWIQSLEAATKELLQQYVTLQAEMTLLRSKRAERLSTEGPYESRFIRTERGHSTSGKYYLFDPTSKSTTQHSTARTRWHVPWPSRRPKLFSIYSVAADVLAWRARVFKTISGLLFSAFGKTRFSRSTFWHGAAESPKQNGQTVRYAEAFLEGYDVVDYIPRQEDRDRHECKRITRDLLRVTQLLEDVFVDFTTVVMSNAYVELAEGHVKPRDWARVPTPLTVGAAQHVRRGNGVSTGFDGEQLLRVIFLRRYADALVHLDPLEANEHKRHKDAAQYAKSLREFRKVENDLTVYLNRTNKDELIRAFVEMTALRPALGTPEDRLRNSIAEFRFWDTHEALWREHVLAVLPPNEQNNMMKMYVNHVRTLGKHINVSSADLDAIHQRNLLRLKGVPIFRGLLCFTAPPHVPVEPASAQPSGEPQAVSGDGPAAASALVVDAQATSVSMADAEATDAASVGQQPPPPQQQQQASVPVAEPKAAPLRSGNERARPGEHASASLKSLRSYTEMAAAVKERWLHELYLFTMTLEETSLQRTLPRKRRPRVYHLEVEDTYIDPKIPQTRHHLFDIISRLNNLYVIPLFADHGAVLRWAGRYLWPPSWVNVLLYGRSENTEVAALRQMGSRDPASQLISAQLLELPWGSFQDAPLMVFNNFFLVPPDLLKLQNKCKKEIFHAWLLMCASIVSLMAILMFC